jgi:hypothetical protein
MALKVSRVDVWAAGLKDKPGRLAEKLAALAAAGANVKFVVARRAPEKPGTGVVFVTPLKGAKQIRAAKKVGFMKTKSLRSVRVEGPDKRGIGAKLAATLADAGINVRGLSAAAISKKFVCYIALDKAAEATKTVRLLKKL